MSFALTSYSKIPCAFPKKLPITSQGPAAAVHLQVSRKRRYVFTQNLVLQFSHDHQLACVDARVNAN
ncbi:hypothetical protein BD410DRAFT_793390 [Rickenella mellea]|uniref:Uncharacterized protein n=1 Tax=Rickenella mellea TaxID=50990 RepID=A0A4Y7PU03_9AGAM|nr:hypothetical protein BD410DRAFT_793390 [Rickenella mellea]